MKDLIEALNIFIKYADDSHHPTGCEHDILYVYVNPGIVSDEDKEMLKSLGFHVDDINDCFRSYRFGSA